MLDGLILTSCGLETPAISRVFLNKVLNIKDNIEDVKAIFVPTAANDPDGIDMLPKCLRDLTRAGVKRENIFVHDLHKDISDEEMDEYDVIYLCGGSTRYLLERINEGEFRRQLIRAIHSGKVVLGVSAGSVIFSNKYKDNLGVFDCPLEVHCDDDEKEEVGRYKLDNTKLDIKLGDNQGIVFVEDEFWIFE